MPPTRLIEAGPFDFDHPLCTIDDIRKVNPQRHEMEQLTGVVHVDPEERCIVGFKDVTDKEFWVNGHMPDFAIMPGVVLCESAAQLASYYAKTYKVLDGDYLGFGGMDNVRFRRPVFPGCRLVLYARVNKVRAGRRAEFEFQGFVDDQMVFNGEMIGVPILANAAT